MIGLAAFADMRLLGFHEVADVRAGIQLAARSQARERADRARTMRDNAVQVAMRLHHGTGSKLHIPETRERANAHVITEGDLAFEDHVDVQLHILAGADRAAHVDAQRVGKAHTGTQQCVCRALSIRSLQRGELQRIVRTRRFQWIGAFHAECSAIFLRRHAKDIGEVILALYVVAAEPADPATQGLRLGDEDAGVDQVDCTLRCIGVLFLDHRLHLACTSTQHAAITTRIDQPRGEQAQGAVRAQQVLQRGHPRHWHIAVQDQHARAVRHPAEGLLHGVTGAQPFGLQHPLQVGLLRERGKHLVAAVAVHHMDGSWLQRAGGVQHVRQQRSAGQWHQHLGAPGFHPRPGASREDEDVQRSVVHANCLALSQTKSIAAAALVYCLVAEPAVIDRIDIWRVDSGRADTYKSTTVIVPGSALNVGCRRGAP